MLILLSKYKRLCVLSAANGLFVPYLAAMKHVRNMSDCPIDLNCYSVLLNHYVIICNT